MSSKGLIRSLRRWRLKATESVARVMYTDSKLPETYKTKYTETELEALYMGTESEARKRFQRQGCFKRRELFDQRSTSRPRSGGFVPHQSKYDR